MILLLLGQKRRNQHNSTSIAHTQNYNPGHPETGTVPYSTTKNSFVLFGRMDYHTKESFITTTLDDRIAIYPSLIIPSAMYPSTVEQKQQQQQQTCSNQFKRNRRARTHARIQCTHMDHTPTHRSTTTPLLPRIFTHHHHRVLENSSSSFSSSDFPQKLHHNN